MKTLKLKLISWLAGKMLPVVDQRNLIKFIKDRTSDGLLVYLDNEPLTQSQLSSLKQEIRFFEESRLWGIINVYFNKEAEKKMFLEAKDIYDIIFCKTVMYVLKGQQEIILNIKNAKG